MKTKPLAMAALLSTATLFTACGDDVTKVTEIEKKTSGLETVASADSLGKCSEKISGEMKFATKENAVFVCADSAWKNVSEAGKTVCSAEALSDGSGFKIVCGGDSVGVVKNGAKGKTGAKGDTGEGCEISDNGDGTVSVVCGESSATLYKALCGNKPYDPDSNICAGGLIAPQSKKNVWDLMNPEIEYGVFVDKRDGQIYRSVEIGGKTWMAENLNFAYNQKTSSLDSSSFCYNNEPDSCAKYGRLYLWSAAMDSVAKFSEAGKDCGYGKTCASATTVRGVCPEGWHLPSEEEVETLLVDAVGGESVAGKALKSISGWEDDDGNSGNGSDSFGFSALPAGFREDSGTFDRDRKYTSFWFAYEICIRTALYVDLDISEAAYASNESKNNSYSVRCVKD